MKPTFFGIIALVSSVLAQADYFQIRTPKKGTTLSPGEISTIQWTEGLKGKVLVNILKGENPRVMMPTGMAFITSGELGMQKWRVPDNLDPNETYALEFNFKTPNGQVAQSFSDQFKISGSPIAEFRTTNLEQSKMTSGFTNEMQAPEKVSSFNAANDNSPRMVEDSTSMIQGKATYDNRFDIKQNQDMRQTSAGSFQDLKQSPQSTQRKPSSRRRMRIIIQYPEQEEEGTVGTNSESSVDTATPVKLNGGMSMASSSAETAKMAAPVAGSVLDSFANAASTKRNNKSVN